MSELVLRWEGGGEATLVTTDGVHAELRSTRSAAPGTPMRASVALASVSSIRFKVQGCRREEGDAFFMRGRWLDLTKRAREELLASVQAQA